MYSHKKFYTVKILRLALTLSLLNVDLNNYLGQDFLRQFDSQMGMRREDGRELEMLRAVPMIDYPYANQKMMIPLVEDLINFNSITRDESYAPAAYNITAYLLNVSNDGSNETLAMQEMQGNLFAAGSNVPDSGPTMTATGSVPNTNAPAVAEDNNSDCSIVTLTDAPDVSIEFVDMSYGFLPSLLDSIQYHDTDEDERSLWEQNLSDLNDFNELSALTNRVQLKDGQQQANHLNLQLGDFLPSFSNLHIEFEEASQSTPAAHTIEAVASNGSFPNPDSGASIKFEYPNEDDVEDDKKFSLKYLQYLQHGKYSDELLTGATSAASDTSGMISIKKEPHDTEEDRIKENADQVHYVKKESDAVEVLWKQDVDLGYSLNFPQTTFNGNGLSSETSGQSRLATTINDDLGRIQFNYDHDDDKDHYVKETKDVALQKPNPSHSRIVEIDLNVGDNYDNDQLEDVWTGIPFTIDNETGEYIRLPLDDILDDVIQFADLADENDQNPYNRDDSASASGFGRSDCGALPPLRQSDLSADKADNKDSGNRNSESEGDLDIVGHHNRINQVNRASASIKIERELEDRGVHNNNNNKGSEGEGEGDVDYLESSLFDLDDEAKRELAGFDMMLHSTAPFAPHPHSHSHPHPHPHPHAHPHPHPHPHPHHPYHHHHHHRTGGTGGTAQNYGGVNSAFHRQPSTSTGFHHAPHQGRMPLSRGVSMEQRLQDIASLFNPISSMGVGVGVGVGVGMGVVGGVSEMSPYHPYPTHHYPYQSAAATGQHGQYGSVGISTAPGAGPGVTAAPPPPPTPTHNHLQHSHAASMIHPSATTNLNDLCSSQPHYGPNLGSAVSSSMHLTNSTHDTDIGSIGAGQISSSYKMEHHDVMYYSNSSSDMTHTTDGFINAILNDEDLHLMDMNVNDNFYRMVDSTAANNSTGLEITNNLTVPHAGHGMPMNGNTVNMMPMGVDARGGGGGDSGSGSSGVGSSSGGCNGTVMAGNGGPGGTNDRLDSSSDSAVSSMGSERISSCSDGEWGEGSDSAQDYHSGKLAVSGPNVGVGVAIGPYDYSYNNNGNTNPNTNPNNNNRQPSVAQKKHHMFGKRFINEQPSANSVNGMNGGASTIHQTAVPPSIKYEYDLYPTITQNHLHHNRNLEGHATPSNLYTNRGACSLDFSIRQIDRIPQDFIQHNHSYAMDTISSCLTVPQARDRRVSLTSTKTLPPALVTRNVAACTKSNINKSSNGGGASDGDTNMTRDEKRARAMNIPIPVCDIINLPMDEFNERLSKYDLSENQLSLIRDIRRRGKNKVAAQNCRKRKLDLLVSLEDDLKEVRQRKEKLQEEQPTLIAERKRLSNKFTTLHNHIFHYLRDPQGNPCSPNDFCLQQALDGSIYLVPRDTIPNNGNDICLDSDDNDINLLVPLNPTANLTSELIETDRVHNAMRNQRSSQPSMHRTQHHQQQSTIHSYNNMAQQQQQQQQHMTTISTSSSSVIGSNNHQGTSQPRKD